MTNVSDAAEGFMGRYPNTLRALSKGPQPTLAFKLIARSGGMGQVILREMLAHEHQIIVPDGPPADVLILAQGYNWEECVHDLHTFVEEKAAKGYVVVTSEHGEIPAGWNYALYASTKAAQKMLCKVLTYNGHPCVDVSPAFVTDSGRQKSYNKDPLYTELIHSQMKGTPPVTSQDVANAVVFAAENLNKIAGSTIHVSAGWRR